MGGVVIEIRDLSIGTVGEDVRVVQQAFNTRKAKAETRLVDDGIFGPKTKAAVVSYQKRYGLKPDGVVGFNTRKQFFPNLAATMRLVVSRNLEPPSDDFLSNANRVRFGGPRLGFAIGASSGGDDDPDANRFPIGPLFQKPLFSGDPADGPIQNFTLNDVTLPAPGLPDNIFGLKKDQAQMQAGSQFQARHIFQNQGKSPNPSGAFVMTLQQVYARNKDQDSHLEVAFGAQVVAPFIARTKDGLLWSVQPFLQFTWADIFWRRGNFHLVSPFAQASAATTFHFGKPVFGLGLFPMNVTFDVTDRISIIGQAGGVGTIDTSNKRIEIGPQAALFGSVSF